MEIIFFHWNLLLSFRAATVVATTEGVLWALVGRTFLHTHKLAHAHTHTSVCLLHFFTFRTEQLSEESYVILHLER